jgi:hypothetical protein
MKSNPCLLCQLKDQDKNNPMCMHCVNRLEYVNYLERELSFGMTHTETKTPAPPRLPALSIRSYLFSVISERYS